MQINGQPADTTDNSDLWADESAEHTDDFAADPADILEARELREGVNLRGMPIDITTH